jgi:mannonate dehydratase
MLRTRRDCIQATLAGLAAAGASQALPMPGDGIGRDLPSRPRGMKFTERFSPDESLKITLGVQSGLKHAIVDVLPVLRTLTRDRYLESLDGIKAHFWSKGLAIAGIESHPVVADKIRLGLPGRDEELVNYLAAIEALGKVGIPMLCYHFMAGFSWYRTRADLPARGGALTTEFDLQAARRQGLTEWGEVSEDKLWGNIEYFLKAAIPAAEKAGVQMALHPDDPPVSPLRGMGRIVTSARNYRRIMNMVPSPVNGVTFCQANFKLMGEDIAALAREWCSEKKIFFVHFRDVEGSREHFRETFHDNGPTDMAEVLKIYSECGFEGPIRPDHAPTMEGEANDHPGYAMEGKILAIGYMKGIMDGLHIQYQ